MAIKFKDINWGALLGTSTARSVLALVATLAVPLVAHFIPGVTADQILNFVFTVLLPLLGITVAAPLALLGRAKAVGPMTHTAVASRAEGSVA